MVDMDVCVPTMDRINFLYAPEEKNMCRSRQGSKCSLSTGVPESNSTGEDSIGLARIFSPRSNGEDSMGLSRAFLELVEPPLPSAGSALHSTNSCEPCKEFWMPQGCAKGAACERCHLCSKGKRLRFAACCPDGARMCADSAGDKQPISKPILKRSSVLDVHANLSEDDSTHILLPPGFKPPPGLPPPLSTHAPQPQAPPGLPAPNTRMCSPCCDPFPSIGSALHGSGMCKPCGWFWKESGCENGEGCLHCHLCPPGEKKARKKGKSQLTAPRWQPGFPATSTFPPTLPTVHHYPPGCFRT